MKNILVIGSLNMDMIICCDQMPKIGETLNGYGYKTACGGKGANQAASAAKLGASVKMLGCIGNDDNGHALTRTLGSLGVNCENVDTVDSPTGVAVITVVGGNNCIIINHGANYEVSPEMIDKHSDLIEWADFVVLQLEIPLETVSYISSIAKQLGKTVILNPAPMDTALDREILGNVHYLIPNEHEAALLLGYELDNAQTEERAAREIYENYGCNTIITLGEKGSIYYDGCSFIRQSAFKVDAVDTTAAGDSFIGGFVFALSDGKSVQQAMEYASAVSACTVSKKGAIPSLPSPREVELILHY